MSQLIPTPPPEKEFADPKAKELWRHFRDHPEDRSILEEFLQTKLNFDLKDHVIAAEHFLERLNEHGNPGFAAAIEDAKTKHDQPDALPAKKVVSINSAKRLARELADTVMAGDAKRVVEIERQLNQIAMARKEKEKKTTDGS